MIKQTTKAMIVIFAVVTMFLCLASATQTATVSAKSGLNMRASNNASAKIITVIPNGASVNVLGWTEDWCRVTYNNKSGYVVTKYLNFSQKTATISRGSVDRDVLGQKRINVVNTAKSFLGTPYRSGGAGPNGFDCSGFTYYVYKLNGYDIARGPSSQLRSLSVSVSKSDLLPGDLVFFKDPNISSSAASHVGIYVGDGQMIHSPNVGQVVKYTSINSGYYENYYIGARRIIN